MSIMSRRRLKILLPELWLVLASFASQIAKVHGLRVFSVSLFSVLRIWLRMTDCLQRWCCWEWGPWNVRSLLWLELCRFRWWIARRSFHASVDPAVSLLWYHDLHVSVPLFSWSGLHSSCNLFYSIAFCACLAANTWNGQNFPFLSQDLFFENGSLYDQLAILDENFRLDPAKLAEVVRRSMLLRRHVVANSFFFP